MQVFRLGAWTFVEYPTMEEADAAFDTMRERWEVKTLVKTDELVKAMRAKKKKDLEVLVKESALSPPHKTRRSGDRKGRNKTKR